VYGKHEMDTVLRQRDRTILRTMEFAIVPLHWTGSMKHGEDSMWMVRSAQESALSLRLTAQVPKLLHEMSQVFTESSKE
jgi:hypothetical protein